MNESIDNNLPYKTKNAGKYNTTKGHQQGNNDHHRTPFEKKNGTHFYVQISTNTVPIEQNKFNFIRQSMTASKQASKQTMKQISSENKAVENRQLDQVVQFTSNYAKDHPLSMHFVNNFHLRLRWIKTDAWKNLYKRLL